jgi:hypothetical protein
MNGIIDKAIRYGAIIIHGLGLYGWWHMWRRSSDRTVYFELPVTEEVEQVVMVVEDRERNIWLKDDWRWALSDRVSDMRRWYTRWKMLQDDTPVPPDLQHSVDCDEATTTAIGMLEMCSDPRLAHTSGPDFLQVVWRDHEGKMHGHHVCVFGLQVDGREQYAWYHLSNWGLRGGIASPQGPVPTFAEEQRMYKWLAEDVANVYSQARPGKIIHAFVCRKPAELRDWTLVA